MEAKKNEILRHGKALFSTQGFKKTSVAEITTGAGIGVGTFYNYFDSKEQLFIALFVNENEKLKQRIIDSVDLDSDPVQVVKEVIALLFSGMKANPILNEWYDRDLFFKLEKQLAKDESWKEEGDFFYSFFKKLVDRWQQEGKLRRDICPDEILAYFNSLTFIDLHRDEIGSRYFPQLLDSMVEFIVTGLKA